MTATPPRTSAQSTPLNTARSAEQRALVNGEILCNTIRAAVNNGSAGLTARHSRRKVSRAVSTRRGFRLCSMARSFMDGLCGRAQALPVPTSGLSTCIVPSTSFDSGDRVSTQVGASS